MFFWGHGVYTVLVETLNRAQLINHLTYLLYSRRLHAMSQSVYAAVACGLEP